MGCSCRAGVLKHYLISFEGVLVRYSEKGDLGRVISRQIANEQTSAGRDAHV